MKKVSFPILLAILICSCRKLVEVSNPIDKITSDKVFQDSSTATAALVGIYTKMGSVGLRIPIISTGAITIFTGLASDELEYTSSVPDEAEFASNSISVNNNIISSGFWRYGYNFIYQTNAVIEGVEGSNNISQSLSNQLVGEAKFLRAFFYFNLVNLFGEVPLIISSDYTQTATVDRAAKDQIYDQIISDLKDAKEKLTITYPAIQRVRVNRFAASALLARVYLYIMEFEKAMQEASEVILSGTYSLESDLNSVFIKSSNEIIWQLIPFATSLSTIEGFKFIPSSAASSLPLFPIREELLDAFDIGDLRKVDWIGNKTIASQVYYYPYKYKVRAIAAGTPQPEYHVMLRLAEILLIRAEAAAHLNNLTQAIQDINLIRQRAGLSSLSGGIDQSQVLFEISKERRLELFAECGHRWFDLKRRNEASAILASLKPTWEPTDTLFPIPQAEILLNPQLIQNPGY